MGPQAFHELFGDEGLEKGSMFAQFEVVEGSNCKGSKKTGGNKINIAAQLNYQTAQVSVSGVKILQTVEAKSIQQVQKTNLQVASSKSPEVNVNSQININTESEVIVSAQPRGGIVAFASSPFVRSFSLIPTHSSQTAGK